LCIPKLISPDNIQCVVLVTISIDTLPTVSGIEGVDRCAESFLTMRSFYPLSANNTVKAAYRLQLLVETACHSFFPEKLPRWK
jgi:hypothetical protein